MINLYTKGFSDGVEKFFATISGNLEDHLTSDKIDKYLDERIKEGDLKDSSNWFVRKWRYGFGKDQEKELLKHTFKDYYLGKSLANNGREDNYIYERLGGDKDIFNKLDLSPEKIDIDKLRSEYNLKGGKKWGFNNDVDVSEKFKKYLEKRNKLIRNRNIGRAGMIGAGAGLIGGLGYAGYKATRDNK